MTRLFAGTAFDIPPRCDHCDELVQQCRCTESEKQNRARLAAMIPPSRQRAKITTAKRKGGRVVTVVTGLRADQNDFAELTTRLKTACGSGGTAKPKADTIEVQGDHVQTVRDTLAEIGYRV